MAGSVGTNGSKPYAAKTTLATVRRGDCGSGVTGIDRRLLIRHGIRGLQSANQPAGRDLVRAEFEHDFMSTELGTDGPHPQQ
jgi:hypothetical protein